MYHSILKDSARQGKYVVSPSVLVEGTWMRYKKTPLMRKLAFPNCRPRKYIKVESPPEKPVMIMSNDGYYNNYVYAYRRCRKRNMRAVVSIIGCQTDQVMAGKRRENAYWSYLTTTGCAEMVMFWALNHSRTCTIMERRSVRAGGEDQTTYESVLRIDTAQTQELLSENGLPVARHHMSMKEMSDENDERLQRSIMPVRNNAESTESYLKSAVE